MLTTMSLEADSGARPLGELGITEWEERVYRLLLAQPAATVREVATSLGVSHRTAQRVLKEIEDKGLATRSPERPRRYNPAPPDMAVEALILRRQEQLQRARAEIQELQEHARFGHPDGTGEHMVELVTSREAEQQIFEYLNRTAQREVNTLVRPPVRVSQLDVPRERDQRTQRSAQARGVRFRTVVDADFLAAPGTVRAVQADVAAGEEVRVVPSVPLKMVLADRAMAMLPLDLQRSDGPVLLVRSSALLDALSALFETLWQRASPMWSATSERRPAARSSGSGVPAGTESLVQLMAAGMNDRAMAQALGVSLRTLERRIAELMEAFDARTRFQVGWLAALHTATDAPEDAAPQPPEMS